LEPSEQESRSIYLLPRLRDRLGDMPQWVSQWDTTQTPLQQFDALAEVFALARN
jgi:hypothetical protein